MPGLLHLLRLISQDDTGGLTPVGLVPSWIHFPWEAWGEPGRLPTATEE